VFGITGFKLMLILIAGLILIGPDKMPDVARTIGKAIRMFNTAKDEMQRMINTDMFSAEQPKSAIQQSNQPTVASTLYADDEDEEEEEE